MGFFLTEQEKQSAKIITEPKKRGSTKHKVAVVAAGARGCDACALKQTWPRIASPRMPISGNTKDADILLLGEAPGKHEDESGRAFVGDSGELLRKALPRRYLDRIAFQN